LGSGHNKGRRDGEVELARLLVEELVVLGVFIAAGVVAAEIGLPRVERAQEVLRVQALDPARPA
jgi:hypothetical protein